MSEHCLATPENCAMLSYSLLVHCKSYHTKIVKYCCKGEWPMAHETFQIKPMQHAIIISMHTFG